MDYDKLMWQFLKEHLAKRKRSLRAVAQECGFGELVILWEAGRTPHLWDKALQALETPTGLPKKFLGFLQHFSLDKNITLAEAHSLAGAHKGSLERHDATLTPNDYMAMLNELRRPNEIGDYVQMKGCLRCDTPFPGLGRCPHCGHPRQPDADWR